MGLQIVLALLLAAWGAAAVFDLDFQRTERLLTSGAERRGAAAQEEAAAPCNQAFRVVVDHWEHRDIPPYAWLERRGKLEAVARLTCGEEEYNAQRAKGLKRRPEPQSN